jgi:hypothetical protein
MNELMLMPIDRENSQSKARNIHLGSPLTSYPNKRSPNRINSVKKQPLIERAVALPERKAFLSFTAVDNISAHHFDDV